MIEELAARQRAEALAATKRRSQRQNEAVFWDGKTATLSNGPTRREQSVLGVGDRMDTPSSMVDRQGLVSIAKKLPFQTLFITSATQRIFLGGDRPSFEILTPINPGVMQLVNLGRGRWSASYLDSLNLWIEFLPSRLREPLFSTLVSPVPIGNGEWNYANPLKPSIAASASTIISGSGNNSVTRISETASLSSTPYWAPYSNTPLPIGSWDTTTTQTYDGVAANAAPSRWNNYAYSQAKLGSRPYQIKWFFYGPARTFLGTNIRNIDNLQQRTIKKTIPRFEETDTIRVLQQDNEQTIAGFFLRRATNQTTENSTLSHVQETGSSGSSSTYDFLKTTVVDNTAIATTGLVGAGVSLTRRVYSGTVATAVTTDNRTLTAAPVTGLYRPPMNNIVLFTAPYIISASLAGGGSNGYFYASSNANPNGPGITVPPLPTAVNNTQEMNQSVPGVSTGTGPWYAGLSCVYSQYDAPGAYGDNFTTANCYAEYQIAHTAGLVPCDDQRALGVSTVYSRQYRRDTIVTTITVPPEYSVRYFLDDVEIPWQFSAIGFGPMTGVSAPTLGAPGVMQLTKSTAIVSIPTAIEVRRETKIATAVGVSPGSNTADPNTTTIQTTYTSRVVSAIGLKAEVYTRVGSVFTRYQGTITAYTGALSPAPPTNSGSNTHVFVGPYPQNQSVTGVTLNITKSEIVPYCPWGVNNNQYRLIINPNYAILERLSAANCTLKKTETGARLWMADSVTYKPGEVNYVAVWDISGGQIEHSSTFLQGKTKPHLVGTFQGFVYCVQYSG